jgi:hypothetical protein
VWKTNYVTAYGEEPWTRTLYALPIIIIIIIIIIIKKTKLRGF